MGQTEVYIFPLAVNRLRLATDDFRGRAAYSQHPRKEESMRVSVFGYVRNESAGPADDGHEVLTRRQHLSASHRTGCLWHVYAGGFFQHLAALRLI